MRRASDGNPDPTDSEGYVRCRSVYLFQIKERARSTRVGTGQRRALSPDQKSPHDAPIDTQQVIAAMKIVWRVGGWRNTVFDLGFGTGRHLLRAVGLPELITHTLDV